MRGDMGPGQAAAKKGLTTPADGYGLGEVHCEARTGRPPFRGETPLEVLAQVLDQEPEPPARLQQRVPSDRETICLKCLEKEPARRYAGAEALGAGEDALDGVGDGLAHVDFPSSSPHALACGGTRLEATYDNLSGQYVLSSEVVWNDDPTASASGGGVSDVFALPGYQAMAGVPPPWSAAGGRSRRTMRLSSSSAPSSGPATCLK